MINLKSRILAQLESMGCGADISDSFPDDFSKKTQIQYTEEENRVNSQSGNGAINSYVRYRIDIWDTVSTSELACQTDAALSSMGLVRTGCMDNNETARKHKIMRYEGIVSEGSGHISAPR
ncbi:MAG: hypothetical protein NC409_12605 [Clostridium sp.]|nr:hypothetical protein [Clostridium sp.]